MDPRVKEGAQYSKKLALACFGSCMALDASLPLPLLYSARIASLRKSSAVTCSTLLPGSLGVH